MKQTKLTSTRQFYMFDLFAGCGGLSRGLEDNNFMPVLVSELNSDALNTYLANRSFDLSGMPFNERNELHFQDIYDLTPENLSLVKSTISDLIPEIFFDALSGSNIDLICGGPPCQGYSGIGHRRSYGVDKKDIPSNKLYEKMIDVIESVRPKIFLFENVRGLLTSKWEKDGKKGEIWEDVLSKFRSIKGYQVRWNLIKAKDYGVPQNRPRVLLVGIRKDIISKNPLLNLDNDPESAIKCGFLPLPNGKAPDPIALLSDLVDPQITPLLLNGQYPNEFKTESYLTRPNTKVQTFLRTRPDGSIMSKGEKLTDQVYSKHKPRVVLKFKHMLDNSGEIPDDFKTKKFSSTPSTG